MQYGDCSECGQTAVRGDILCSTCSDALDREITILNELRRCEDFDELKKFIEENLL